MLMSTFTFKPYYFVAMNYFLPAFSATPVLLLMELPESFSLFMT